MQAFYSSKCPIVSHSSELLIVLLLDQFKSFLAETLASEADGHPSDVYHGSIEANHSCQTDKALLTGIGVSFLRGEFRVRGVPNSVWYFQTTHLHLHKVSAL